MLWGMFLGKIFPDVFGELELFLKDKRLPLCGPPDVFSLTLSSFRGLEKCAIILNQGDTEDGFIIPFYEYDTLRLGELNGSPLVRACLWWAQEFWFCLLSQWLFHSLPIPMLIVFKALSPG